MATREQFETLLWPMHWFVLFAEGCLEGEGGVKGGRVVKYSFEFLGFENWLKYQGLPSKT
jgi:hypothetical protein